VRDLDPTVTDKIEEWLSRHGINHESAACLTEVIPMAGDDETEAFGESLPSGFVLHE